MKVTFVSNYINHHQMPFCEAMVKHLGNDFYFIQTEPMEAERVNMGWSANVENLSYVKLFYEQEETCKALIKDSDIVLFGGVDDESYITERLHAGKIVVRLSERIYKTGQWKAVSPKGLLKKYNDHTKYRKNPVYLLCCGGYVASDFHIVRAYPHKKFKWGYFPRLKEQNIEELIEKKQTKSKETGVTALLWAGRFIDWKHPEMAIEAARRLKEEGYQFHLNMVGGGFLDENLKTQVTEQNLNDVVTFQGFKNPEEVRGFMEESQLFLFTSDFQEGWGAVLNEAMNSGCTVIANCGIGAVPFLIKPDVNGCIYRNGDFESFYHEICSLLESPEKQVSMGKAAYETISLEWNAERAAEKLIHMLTNLLNGQVEFAPEGILSEAKAISPRKMFHYLTK